MALLQSDTAKGIKPIPSVMGALISALLYEFVTGAAALAAGDIIDLGDVPPDVAPCDVALIADDLDTNAVPAVTLSVGFLNAAKTDLIDANNTFIAASTVGQAGGIARATTPNVYLFGGNGGARRLGIKVVAAPATSAGAGKKVAVKLEVNA